MKKIIYWSGLEYKYGKDVIKEKKIKGGFVYAFMEASDVRDALQKLLNELKEQNLNPSMIEFVSPYDRNLEWEDEKTTNNYIELYEDALDSKKVVFDTFYAYER